MNEITDYCTAVSSAESETCQGIRQYARANYPTLDVMISGPLENALLKYLIRSTQAHTVLEIGTFVGYSALSMAECLPDSGKLYTLDISETYVNDAKKFWGQTEAGEKIMSIIGPATSFLESCSIKFDLIFIDADKPSYPTYFKLALECLSSKGSIVIDNALWGGKVLEEYPKDENARAVKRLNQQIRDRDDLQSVLLPIRDGVHLVTRC